MKKQEETKEEEEEEEEEDKEEAAAAVAIVAARLEEQMIVLDSYHTRNRFEPLAYTWMGAQTQNHGLTSQFPFLLRTVLFLLATAHATSVALVVMISGYCNNPHANLWNQGSKCQIIIGTTPRSEQYLFLPSTAILVQLLLLMNKFLHDPE